MYCTRTRIVERKTKFAFVLKEKYFLDERDNAFI